MPAYFRCPCGGDAIPPARLCPNCLWNQEAPEDAKPYRDAKMWAGIVNEAGARAEVIARMERGIQALD